MALSRQWVAIPIINKLLAVLLDIIKKESVQKPDVMGIVPLKEVETFKAGKEGPPASGKMSSSLKPKPFNPGIVSGPVEDNHIAAHLQVLQDSRSPHE